jgi:hypothetical protein
MRVRIKKCADDLWVVESKKWYDISWKYEKAVFNDNAEKLALEYARNLLDPVIIELTKEHHG